ncbi:probable BOI-related E3 ubiquitin-protein ligase 3 [Humulus lupulus]|uniref:probable BOI-related E3 ubiquitin-protein ligase 3 n=1 Tax=Humulus lupulus TaxID=3486 RepID=UPI002B408ED3|nr:probable BOI-related E3 ubiquitin-protein ligase 3 [Humulus lupulus]
MAVEARHLNLFHSQLIGNREMMNPIEATTNMYNSQMGYHGGLPLPTETLLPVYNPMYNDSVPPPKTAKKSDSGLTYNIPTTTTTSFSRKRSRDSSAAINNNPLFLSFPATTATTTQPIHYKNSTSPFSFLGEDLSYQIQQQQFDLDRLISQHMEKVRMEVDERRKKQARKIMEAIEIGMMKRLRAKEEEIEKIGKLNWALEERVKTLCVENQIWRDLAQSNEATANALRTDLEQVLAQVKGDHRTRGVGTGLLADDVDIDNENDDVQPNTLAAALADDAQSCCGENDDVVVVTTGEWRSTLSPMRNDVVTRNNNNDVVDLETTSNVRCTTINNGGSTSNNINRLCRNCGKEESCVLLLPCRHLCLCTVCGSSLHTCPICKSTKNASVHVNMS